MADKMRMQITKLYNAFFARDNLKIERQNPTTYYNYSYNCIANLCIDKE